MKETAFLKLKIHFSFFFLNYLVPKLELAETLSSFDTKELKEKVFSSADSFRKSPSEIGIEFAKYNTNNPYNKDNLLPEKKLSML